MQQEGKTSLYRSDLYLSHFSPISISNLLKSVEDGWFRSTYKAGKIILAAAGVEPAFAVMITDDK